LFNFTSIVLNGKADANKKNTTTHRADGSLLLIQASIRNLRDVLYMSSNQSDDSSRKRFLSFDHDELTDMEITLNLLENMNMPQLQENNEIKTDVSESFLNHVEETAELLENPYAKSLLKQAVKQIRESKNKDT